MGVVVVIVFCQTMLHHFYFYAELSECDDDILLIKAFLLTADIF